MAFTIDDLRAPPRPRQPLTRDQALVALARAKGEARRRGDLIRRIHAGRLGADPLEALLLRRVHDGFASLEPAGRDALLRLLLHVDARAPDLLSTAWGTDRFGPRPGNTLVDGLVALARFHEGWQRPVDAWRARHRGERERFGDLARHLLARYEVPGFFDSVWFCGGAQGRRQQGWFAHLGAGGNLRTADGLPLPLTKRMAHEALRAPRAATVEQALRWGQVVGSGGSPGLAAAVNATRLGRAFEHEAFWGTVVLFLVRSQTRVRLDDVGAIVDYLHHQRFAPQEVMDPDGSLGSGPPAEPNLSMKSRSLPKLLRHVARWRQAWRPALERHEEEAACSRKVGHLYLVDADDRTGRPLVWTIQELRSARSLANEGHLMGHCLTPQSVRLATCSIWSLQVRDGERTRRVMTVEIDIDRRSVTQARGRFNASPDRQIAAEGARLSPREGDLLRQSHRILRLWLDREGLSY